MGRKVLAATGCLMTAVKMSNKTQHKSHVHALTLMQTGSKWSSAIMPRAQR